MPDIIERFDFDDKPGIEKLRNVQSTAEDVGSKIKKMGEEVEQAIDKSTKKAADMDGAFGKISKSIGTVGKVAAGVAGAATLAFGAATAAALKLGQENARIQEQQEALQKQFGEVRKLLGDKLAPIIFVIQESVGKLLEKVLKTGGDINNSVIVKIAAGIKGIQAAVGQAFTNLKTDLKIAGNEFKVLGKNIQAIFSRGSKKDSIKAEIEALKNENIQLAKDIKPIGEAYRDAFNAAKKEIGDLVSSGYFNLKKANKEQIEAIKKLRDEYAKLTADINKQIEQARLETLSGIDRINAEEKIALDQINKQEEYLKKLAERAGIVFDQEENFNTLRLLTQAAFDKERTDLLIEEERKRREAAMKANKEFYKELAPLEEEGQKTLTDIGLEAAREQNVVIEKRVEEIKKKLNPETFAEFKERILKSLNITEEEAGFILAGVGQALTAVKDLFTANIDARIADNDRLLDSIKERRSVIQSELDQELKLQEQGRENNVASKREELKRLKQEEDAALRERQKLEAKARRAQVLSDSVQQTSSLITAASNVFKGFSNIPIVGLALGAAAVLTLFTLFNSAKQKAAAASKPDRAYKGGSLKGRVKKEGGFVNWLYGRPDKPGQGEGHRVEGSNLVLGGREMVVAEGPANSQSDDFWDAMNAGKYNSIDLASTLEDHLTSPKTINRNFEKRHTSPGKKWKRS